MKKIYLEITPFFPSKDSFRGPFVLDQVKAIQKVGNYEVTVLKPKPLFSKLQDYQFEGVTVHYFKRVVLPSNILPGLFKGLSTYFFFKKLKQLNLDAKRIEVAHAHVTANGFYANLLKVKNPNIKTVLQHHGFDVLSLENGKLKNWSWHCNWVKNHGVSICNKIDLHIGVSAKTLSCVSAFSEIKMKSKYVLYNGVDAEIFHAIDGLKDDKIFKIGCIANFWPLKDQMTLIKATQQLIAKGMDNLKVVFIGSGPLLESCKSYVASNQLATHITFQKEVTHKELNIFYNTLDLYVMPSYFEAFGCVYTEAHACGVPFMAVKGQGIEEIMTNESRKYFLIDKGNWHQLEKHILNYYKKPVEQKLNINVTIDFLISKFLNSFGLI